MVLRRLCYPCYPLPPCACGYPPPTNDNKNKCHPAEPLTRDTILFVVGVGRRGRGAGGRRLTRAGRRGWRRPQGHLVVWASAGAQGEGGSASRECVTAMYLTWGDGPRDAHTPAPAGGPHSGSESELPAGDTRWSLVVWDSWRRRRNLKHTHICTTHSLVRRSATPSPAPPRPALVPPSGGV